MTSVGDRAAKVEELLRRRDRLLLSNVEWAQLTRRDGRKGLSYQTVRRMENGISIPRTRTLRLLEIALDEGAPDDG